MRFLATPSISPNMRIALILLMSAVSLFIVSHYVLEAMRYGVTPQQVTAAVAGDEELFIDPLPFEELLLQVHMNLFFIFLLLGIVGATYIRLFAERRSTRTIILLLGISSLTAQPIFLLITVAGNSAAALWLALTLVWHLAAFAAALFCIRALSKGSK